jgi:hypothetical protein
MVRLLKLVLVVLILNAVWRVGSAYWEYYQFRDAVQEAAQFSAGKSDEVVQEQVVQQAVQFGVPVTAESVRVRRQDQRTYIDAAYVRDIELVPRAMRRTWRFSVNVSAWAIPPIEHKSSTP